MVSDSEPRYRLVDSQGNTVGTLYAKSGGTLALQEGSSGSDNEIELQTDGTLQTDSVKTEKLTIGQSNALRINDSYTQAQTTSSQVDVQFSISSGNRYFLKFDLVQPRSSGQIEIIFNNDDAVGNGNYEYYDETSTLVSPADSIVLFETDGFSQIGGTVRLGGRFQAIGLVNSAYSARPGDVSGFATRGSWQADNSVSSITIRFHGGLTENDTIRLWTSV